jgi:hypothetical protein
VIPVPYGLIPGPLRRYVDNFGGQVYQLPRAPRPVYQTPIGTYRPPTAQAPQALSSADELFPNVRLMTYQSPNRPAWEHFGFDLCRPTVPRDNGIQFALPFLTNKFRAWVLIVQESAVAHTPNYGAKLHLELFNRDNPTDRIEIPFACNSVSIALSNGLIRSRTFSRELPYSYWNGAAWVTRNFRYSWAMQAAIENASPNEAQPNSMHCFISENGGASELIYSVAPITIDMEMFCNTGLFRLEPWASSDAPFEALPSFWAFGSVLFYCEDK